MARECRHEPEKGGSCFLVLSGVCLGLKWLALMKWFWGQCAAAARPRCSTELVTPVLPCCLTVARLFAGNRCLIVGICEGRVPCGLITMMNIGEQALSSGGLFARRALLRNWVCAVVPWFVFFCLPERALSILRCGPLPTDASFPLCFCSCALCLCVTSKDHCRRVLSGGVVPRRLHV